MLRARTLSNPWQRTALAVSGIAGTAFVAAARIDAAGSAARDLGLAALFVAVESLCAAAWLLPGRRVSPFWVRAADLLEFWTAIATVPLLLQLFHVYARFRALIH